MLFESGNPSIFSIFLLWQVNNNNAPPEDCFGEVKGVLYDACGGDPDPQDVLQCRDVKQGRDSVQVAQVTETFKAVHQG